MAKACVIEKEAIAQRSVWHYKDIEVSLRFPGLYMAEVIKKNLKYGKGEK